jgi:hypothetical protein
MARVFLQLGRLSGSTPVNVAPHALHDGIPLGSGLGAGINRTSPFLSYRFDDPMTSGESPSEADDTDGDAGDARDASDLSSKTGLFSRKTGETRRIFDLSMLESSRRRSLSAGTGFGSRVL